MPKHPAPIESTSLNDRFLDEAVETLRDGGIIIYPTDTLYALGCSALSGSAIDKLCQFKGIDPRKNTLSIVCSDMSQASEYARIDNKAFKIIRALTPGPFTFLLPASTTLPKVFKGRHMVGVRIPDNPIARELAAALGNPLLSTSIPVDESLGYEANTLPEEIMLRYENLPFEVMIDGGQGDIEPSTIVDLSDSSGPQIVRQGRGEFQL
ncbi:MAG: threonylcarbamoyl-AMP synthase [Muribaculaceae bacterium]|nr:threonylcarbamoyl-AMP synthase [Muribaculaceae bacterium]